MRINIFLGLIAITLLNRPIHVAAQVPLSDSSDIISQASAQDFFQQARGSYESGDYDRAIESASRAISLNSQLGEAYYIRGLAQYAVDQFAEAIGDYTQAISLFSNDADGARAFYSRGLAHSASENFQQAIYDFTEAIRLNPDNELLIESEAYYQRGFLNSEISEVRRAVEDLTKAIELDRDNVRAYTQRGLIYEQYFGDVKAAVSDFLVAVELDPQDSEEAYWNRGAARYALGDSRGALEDVTRAIQLNPNYVRPYTARATINLEFGKFDEMIVDFQKATQISPDSWVLSHAFASTVLNLNYLASVTGQGSDDFLQLLSQAHDVLSQATLKYDKNSFLYLARGVISLQFNRPVEALSDFTQVLVLEPNYAAAYLQRGMAHYQRRQLEGARADLDRAIQLSPNYADAYLRRGAIRLELADAGGRSDVEKAIGIYNDVLRLSPNMARIYESRGHAHRVIGNEQQATADFSKAASLHQQQGNQFSAEALTATVTNVTIADNLSILETSGTLSPEGERLSTDNSLFQTHSFEGNQGQSIAITMTSNEFDTYLVLADSSGQAIAENDDVSRTNSNSQISVVLPESDTYTVLANAYDSSGQGSYNLAVRPGAADGYILRDSGTLGPGDHTSDDGSLYQVHFFEGRQDQAVTITMISAQFDAYLMLNSPSGERVGENDDISLGNTNAQITTILPEDGVYSVLANSYDSSGEGEYFLTVE